MVAIVTWRSCYRWKPSDYHREAVVWMSSRMLMRTSRWVTGTEVVREHARVLRIGSALPGPFPTDFINWPRLGLIVATYAIHGFTVIVGRLPCLPSRMSCWEGAALHRASSEGFYYVTRCAKVEDRLCSGLSHELPRSLPEKGRAHSRSVKPSDHPCSVLEPFK